MCLIVDASCAGITFGARSDAESVPIVRWLLKGDGCLVYGGKLAKELFRLGRVARFLGQLRRAGRAIELDPAAVRTEEQRVARHTALTCDDPHVLAVARVSGARTLRTEDGPLMNDFRNTSLVPRPPGKIYRRASEHGHLLCHCQGCPRYGDRAA